MAMLLSVAMMTALTACDGTESSNAKPQGSQADATTTAATTTSATTTAAEQTTTTTATEPTNKTEDNILPGIYLGMPFDEVMWTLHFDYSDFDDSLIPYNEPNEPEDWFTTYNIGTIDRFGTEMVATVWFQFTPQNILYSYYYIIGEAYDENWNPVKGYEPDELPAIAADVKQVLTDWYGEGVVDKEQIVYEESILWNDTEFGHVTLNWGTDLYSAEGYSSGIHHIIVSCTDEEVKTAESSKYYEEHRKKPNNNPNTDTSDGVIGDNDGDGDIDGDDWEIEWKDYLDNAMG